MKVEIMECFRKDDAGVVVGVIRLIHSVNIRPGYKSKYGDIFMVNPDLFREMKAMQYKEIISTLADLKEIDYEIK